MSYKKIILSLALLIAFMGNAFAQKKPVNPLAGKWVLEQLLTTTDKPAWTKKPELVFNTKEKTVSGYDGCNLLMGKFRQSDNKTLRFEAITGTLKACAGNGPDLFLNAIDQTDHYRIRNGKLELLKGTKVLLRLSRK